MLKIKLLKEGAKALRKAHVGDAGFDAFCIEGFTVPARGRITVGIGIAVEFDSNYVLMAFDKSGLASKKGIYTIGGVIDSGYRGEIHAILVNSTDEDISFEAGEKVVQYVLMPCYTGTEIEIVDELSETDRGEGKFGSTGNK